MCVSGENNSCLEDFWSDFLNFIVCLLTSERTKIGKNYKNKAFKVSGICSEDIQHKKKLLQKIFQISIRIVIVHMALEPYPTLLHPIPHAQAHQLSMAEGPDQMKVATKSVHPLPMFQVKGYSIFPERQALSIYHLLQLMLKTLYSMQKQLKLRYLGFSFSTQPTDIDNCPTRVIPRY